MAKRTDEELMQYHLQKAKQAENRIKQKERRAKMQQRKKENSIKFTMGGLMFKYFGADVAELSRREIEAYVSGWDPLFANNEKNVAVFRERAMQQLNKYRSENEKKE